MARANRAAKASLWRKEKTIAKKAALKGTMTSHAADHSSKVDRRAAWGNMPVGSKAINTLRTGHPNGVLRSGRVRKLDDVKRSSSGPAYEMPNAPVAAADAAEKAETAISRTELAAAALRERHALDRRSTTRGRSESVRISRAEHENESTAGGEHVAAPIKQHVDAPRSGANPNLSMEHGAEERHVEAEDEVMLNVDFNADDDAGSGNDLREKTHHATDSVKAPSFSINSDMNYSMEDSGDDEPQYTTSSGTHMWVSNRMSQGFQCEESEMSSPTIARDSRCRLISSPDDVRHVPSEAQSDCEPSSLASAVARAMSPLEANTVRPQDSLITPIPEDRMQNLERDLASGRVLTAIETQELITSVNVHDGKNPVVDRFLTSADKLHTPYHQKRYQTPLAGGVKATPNGAVNMSLYTNGQRKLSNQTYAHIKKHRHERFNAFAQKGDAMAEAENDEIWVFAFAIPKNGAGELREWTSPAVRADVPELPGSLRKTIFDYLNPHRAQAVRERAAREETWRDQLAYMKAQTTASDNRTIILQQQMEEIQRENHKLKRKVLMHQKPRRSG